jgi:hypothetical protein
MKLRKVETSTQTKSFMVLFNAAEIKQLLIDDVLAMGDVGCDETWEMSAGIEMSEYDAKLTLTFSKETREEDE